ncbi:MAG: hypothetical protein R2748_02125 [Bryobacterales bacterium]
MRRQAWVERAAGDRPKVGLATVRERAALAYQLHRSRLVGASEDLWQGVDDVADLVRDPLERSRIRLHRAAGVARQQSQVFGVIANALGVFDQAHQ